MNAQAQHTPTKHSNLVGGSSASRVLSCPASVRLSQKMPPQQSSAYADEGTALHNAVEYCLYEGLSDEDGRLADHLFGREFYGLKLNMEQAETVVKAMAMFDEYWDMLVEEDGEEPVFAIEVQVAFPDIPDAFGTADILMMTRKRSIVWDWKFGAGVVVTASENKQMAFYARGAAHSAPAFFWPEGLDETMGKARYRRVEFVIAQPRISEEPSRWETTFSYLEDFQIGLCKAVAEIDNPSPRSSRGEHCRWCQATPICPAYDDEANDLADILDGTVTDLTPVEKGRVEAGSGSTPVVCTPDVMASWLATADIVETWAKSVRNLAMEQAEQGNCPAGTKLVNKLSNLTYVHKDEPDKVDKMLANKGLKAADRRKVVPITPTQANKLLKKAGKKLLTEAQADRFVSGHALVGLDDKREAVAVLTDDVANEVAEVLEGS